MTDILILVNGMYVGKYVDMSVKVIFIFNYIVQFSDYYVDLHSTILVNV